MWKLPEKACVRCSVMLSMLSAASAEIKCEELCLSHDCSESSEEAELDNVSGHMIVCLLERSADTQQ